MRALLLLPVLIGVDLWIRGRVWCLRRRVQPVTADERAALAGWFNEQTLEVVRVASAPPPVPGVIRLLGRWRPDAVVTAARGITFGRAVIVEPGSGASLSLLFHELVHVVQWVRLGRLRFLMLYADGLLRDGYRDSPLEQVAYDFTARFERSERFDAESGAVEVCRALSEEFRGRGWGHRLAWALAAVW